MAEFRNLGVVACRFADGASLRIEVKPKDVVSIPRAELIYVIGSVKRAGGFVLNEREHISVFPGPPTIYHSLLEHPDRRRCDHSSLRVAVTGAADIPVELIRRVRRELPFQDIFTGYGLTEAGTVTLSRPGDSFEDIATTVANPRRERRSMASLRHSTVSGIGRSSAPWNGPVRRLAPQPFGKKPATTDPASAWRSSIRA